MPLCFLIWVVVRTKGDDQVLLTQEPHRHSRTGDRASTQLCLTVLHKNIYKYVRSDSVIMSPPQPNEQTSRSNLLMEKTKAQRVWGK